MTAQPSPNSRFQVVDRPVAAPGKCAVCGATDRACVDFGMDIDDYGVFYLCTHCMREGALVTGLVVTVEDYDFERMKAGQSISDYLTAHHMKVVTDELAESIHHLVDRLPTAFPDLHVHLGDDVAATDDAANVDNGQELLPFDDSDDDTAGQDSKPSRKRGPSSVPANTVFEPLV